MTPWLIVTLDFPPAFVGGIASWASDLALALAERGAPVTVLAKDTGDTRGWDATQPYEIVRMPGRSWGRWQGSWAALAAARWLLRRRPRGLRVICATWRLAWPLVRAPWPADTRLAVAFHGSELTRLRQAPRALTAVGRRVDAMLPVSHFLAAELSRLGLGPERVQVTPMPLPIPPQPRPPGRGLACLARPTPLKGLDRARQLAALLGEPLEIIADLPRDEALSRLAAARACVLLPRVDADGSGAEGLGLALLEAAALGLGVIGCATGGVPEATGPGVILDDPDHPSAADLARVRALLSDPLSGERAHAWVSAHHGARRTLAVLDEVLR